MSEQAYTKILESQSRVITSSPDFASVEAGKILADFLCLKGDCFVSRGCRVEIFVSYDGVYPAVSVSQGYSFLKIDFAHDTEDFNFVSATSASFALSCLLAHLYSTKKRNEKTNPFFHICYPSELKRTALEVLKGGAVDEFINYVEYIEKSL